MAEVNSGGRVYLGRLDEIFRRRRPARTWDVAAVGEEEDEEVEPRPVREFRPGGIVVRVRPELPDRLLDLAERMAALSERAAATARFLGTVMAVALGAGVCILLGWYLLQRSQAARV